MSHTTTTDEVSVGLGQYKLVSTPSGYKRLLKFYSDCQQYKNCTVNIDFSQLEWFDGNLSAILFSMIYKLNKENGLTFSVDMDLIESKFDILMRNGFIDQDIVVSKSNSSFVKLQAFDIKSSDSFYDYVTNDLFKNVGLSKMIETTKTRMIENLFEVFANVQHARTEHPVFACGQYFPMMSRMKFTLVDLGVGFLTPISEFTNGKITEPKDAILWALTDKNSTKVNQIGGFGLSDIHKFCVNSKSHLSIMSDGVAWGTDYGQMGHQKVTPFCGTVITLDFSCN